MPDAPETLAPEALDRWFAGSVLVDQGSAPLVVCHATPHDFAVPDFRTAGFAAHFGDQETADLRARQGLRGGGTAWLKPWPQARVLECVLALKNPVRLPDLHDWDPRAVIRKLIEAKVLKRQEVLGWVDRVRSDWHPTGLKALDYFVPRLYDEFIYPALRARGIDGVVYRNDYEGFGMDSWIVLDAAQIRDARDPAVAAWLEAKRRDPAPDTAPETAAPAVRHP